MNKRTHPKDQGFSGAPSRSKPCPSAPAPVICQAPIAGPGPQAPTFETAIGYALWDIHHGKYPDRLVPHTEAAAIARLKVATLTTMRSRKAGPPYIRLFGTPYYDLVELVRWIEQKMEFNRV